MKKLVLLCVIAFSFQLTVKAEGTDLKSLLVANEWELNIGETFTSNDVSLKKGEIKLHELITRLYNLKFDFDAKNNLRIRYFDIPVFTGTYSIGRGELIFVNDLKKDKTVFKIISQNQGEIIIRDKEHNVDLVLNALKDQADLKTILTATEWKVDVESMKDNLKVKMNSSPETAYLSQEQKDRTMQSTLLALTGVRYSFQQNNVMDYKIMVRNQIFYQTKGTFTVDNVKGELIFNTEDEPNKVHKVLSAGKDKIVLRENGNELVLVPLKSSN